MDIEHPHITKARLTGYPYNIKKAPSANGANKNNLCGNYTTDGGNKEMSLIELINDHMEIRNKLIEQTEEFGVVAVNIDGSFPTVQFYEVIDFFRESEGRYVEIKQSDDEQDPLHRATFNVHGVEYIILLDHTELQELEGLLHD